MRGRGGVVVCAFPRRRSNVSEKQDVAQETAGEQQAKSEQKELIAFTRGEVKDEEGSVKRYCVEVAPEILGTKLEEVLQSLRKTVIVEGFRRGKAPVSLLKTRYGKDAEQDALNEIAASVTEQIIEADALNVVGEPTLHDSKVEADKPVALEIDIEVRPTVDVQGYTDGTYEVEVAAVTDAGVEARLEELRKSNATYEPVADKAQGYAKGNGAALDIVVVGPDGKRMESLCQENMFLRDPQQSLLTEVAEALVGKKPGETFEQKVSRTVKNRTGEEETYVDTYTVTVREIKECILPELDDEFAKDLGDYATLDDLRKSVRETQESQADSQKRRQVVDKVLDHLIEVNAFSAPRTLVNAQQYQNVSRQINQLRMFGMDPAKMGFNTEAYMEVARVQAERDVKSMLLVEEIAKKEKLVVGDADVDQEIERLAKAQGRKPLAVRARLEAEKRLDGLKDELLGRKVEDYLMEKNTISVVEPKPKSE